MATLLARGFHLVNGDLERQEMGFERPLDIHIRQAVHPEPKDRGLEEAQTEELSVLLGRVAQRRGLVAIPGRFQEVKGSP